MLTLEDALNKILEALPSPLSEQVAVHESHGRILASSIVAPINLPVFDNSSMDGYAIRSEDVTKATAEAPVSLRLIGRVPAGESFAGELTRGTAVRLFTGSPMPRGADAVVMQEDTRTESNRPDEVFILEGTKPWENVRLRGEDIQRGALVASAGDLLTIGRIALLSALGVAEIEVFRRPVVSVIATGSELKEAGEALGPGQIYESNRAALTPLIRSAGGLPKPFPIVIDDLETTRRLLKGALQESDIVVTCGGVSVGEMDFVKAAFEQSGGSLQFWKVAIKPGRPFVFGRIGNKFLFGLPGNPVSALVTFLLLVRPALLRWQGSTEILLPSFTGTLAEALKNPGERRHFMRVRMDLTGAVHSAGLQASHVLSTVATANGLIDVPPNTTLAAGSAVRVLRWD